MAPFLSSAAIIAVAVAFSSSSSTVSVATAEPRLRFRYDRLLGGSFSFAPMNNNLKPTSASFGNSNRIYDEDELRGLVNRPEVAALLTPSSRFHEDNKNNINAEDARQSSSGAGLGTKKQMGPMEKLLRTYASSLMGKVHYRHLRNYVHPYVNVYRRRSPPTPKK